MKITFCFTVLFFLVHRSYGQVNTKVTVWEFYSALLAEATKPCSEDCDSVDRLAFEKQFFASENPKVGLDTTTQYQLLFAFEDGWTHTIGQPDFSDLPTLNTQLKKTEKDSLVTPEIAINRDMKVVRKDAKTYSGKELFDGLMIMHSFISQGTPIESYPIVFERQDVLNCQWFPISTDEYLILRYVHSYPHGNMTSFYHERMLYFRKAE